MNMISIEEFDAVLCDIALPDGMATTSLRSQRKRPVKAVALSGFARDSDIRGGREAGSISIPPSRLIFHECALFWAGSPPERASGPIARIGY